MQSAPTRAQSFLRDLRGGRARHRRGVVMFGACLKEGKIDDPQSAWATVRSELERSLPAATFDLWIDPLQAAGAQAETLYLTGPARVRTWVERRYLGSLEEALRRLGSGFERIQLVDPPSKASPGAGTARVAEPVPGQPLARVRPLRDRPGQPLRPRRRAGGGRGARRGLQPALSTRAARASARRT